MICYITSIILWKMNTTGETRQDCHCAIYMHTQTHTTKAGYCANNCSHVLGTLAAFCYEQHATLHHLLMTQAEQGSKCNMEVQLI